MLANLTCPGQDVGGREDVEVPVGGACAADRCEGVKQCGFEALTYGRILIIFDYARGRLLVRLASGLCMGITVTGDQPITTMNERWRNDGID
jgi:hypothetical protein